MEELLQQHQRACFEPINVHEMLNSEIKCSMISLVLLTEKLDGQVKVVQLYSTKPNQEQVGKENKSYHNVIN